MGSNDESTWSWPRSNPALTTLLPLLAGGHFSLLAPLGEIQFAPATPSTATPSTPPPDVADAAVASTDPTPILSFVHLAR